MQVVLKAARGKVARAFHRANPAAAAHAPCNLTAGAAFNLTIGALWDTDPGSVNAHIPINKFSPLPRTYSILLE